MLRRYVAVLLIIFLLVGGIVVCPSEAWANNKNKKVPPGQAKKYYLDLENFWEDQWEDIFDDLAERLDKNWGKLSQIKYLTRAQVAYILAERSPGFEEFNNQEKILSKVSDQNAIPMKYRKAVAFVINAELMSTKKQHNGKITFQPNKAAKLSDILDIDQQNDYNQEKNTNKFSGTVRLIYVMGSNTWVAVETPNSILRTAYFPAGSVPGGLAIGKYISLKVQNYKIVACSLTASLDRYPNLSFSITPLPNTPRVNQEVILLPQLVNNGGNPLTLENLLYRFTLKKVGTALEWQFTASSTGTVTIPSNNSGNPINLVLPSSKWVPASSGDYVLSKAQIKVNNGDWIDIAYQQPKQTVNLFSANQSNVESGTAGFSPYGYNTYAGSSLSRDTTEKWQGTASLRVLTNGLSPWQGVNTVYSGAEISGTLTGSFYIKAPVGIPFRVVVYDNTNNTYPSGGALEFTGTGNWERKSVTFTPTAKTKNLSLQITLNNQAISTYFWLDGLQLEQGSIATGWIQGGTTKAEGITVNP